MLEDEAKTAPETTRSAHEEDLSSVARREWQIAIGEQVTEVGRSLHAHRYQGERADRLSQINIQAWLGARARVTK